MKNWRSKESKLLSQRLYPERAGHQAVLLCWFLRQKVLACSPELGVDVTCPKRLVSASPFFFHHRHVPLLASVSCNLPQCETVYVYRCIYTQKCKHLIICWSIQLHSVHWRGRIISLTKMTSLNAWSVLVTPVLSDFCDPHRLIKPTGTLCNLGFSAEYWNGLLFLLQGSSYPDSNLASCMYHKFIPSEPLESAQEPVNILLIPTKRK